MKIGPADATAPDRFAPRLGEIAGVLASQAHPDACIASALLLARSMIPFDRCGLLRVGRSGFRSIVMVPRAGVRAGRDFQRRLNHLWLRTFDNDVVRLPPVEPTNRIALPVVVDDAIAGIVLAERRRHREYHLAHLRLLSVVASQLEAYLGVLQGRPDEEQRPMSDVEKYGGRRVPIACPRCGAIAGYPHRARTSEVGLNTIGLALRCRPCGHEWEEHVRTYRGLLFEPDRE